MAKRKQQEEEKLTCTNKVSNCTTCITDIPTPTSLTFNGVYYCQDCFDKGLHKPQQIEEETVEVEESTTPNGDE